MVFEAEQDRVTHLLKETVPILCRSGLSFSSECCIEALIGITVDKNNVFLVSIKEIVSPGEDGELLAPASEASVVKENEKSKCSPRRRSRTKRRRLKIDSSLGIDLLQNEADEPKGNGIKRVKREDDEGSDTERNNSAEIETEVGDAHLRDVDSSGTVSAEEIDASGFKQNTLESVHSKQDSAAAKAFSSVYESALGQQSNCEKIREGCGEDPLNLSANADQEDAGSCGSGRQHSLAKRWGSVNPLSVQLPVERRKKEKLHRCEICKRFYTDAKSLARHRKIHDGLRYYCSTCGFSTSYQDYYNDHVKHCINKLVCDHGDCGLEFTSVRGLYQHKQSVHQPDGQFSCHCGKTFKNRKYLKQHVLGVHGKSCWLCTMCGKQFQWKSALKRHKQKHL